MKKIIKTILLLGIPFTTVNAQQNISTVAGNGTGAFNNDNIQATASELFTPCSIAFDAAGNFYIADEQNNRIRKVNIVTGIITTVAGTGGSSYSGDNGPATAASMYWPAGVAVDGNGNVLITDQRHNAIRKVDAISGNITTIAGTGVASFSGDGNQATTATLNQPVGISVDANNNIFFADATNNRIRKIDASTGIISTVAGNGTAGFSGDGNQATSAEFNFPYSVDLDANGNLFIADQNNNRIRKVDMTTGIISTVVGNGVASYSGDGFQATAAEINDPKQAFIGPGGNMLIADGGNNRVREVNMTTGIITTIAGYAAGYNGDGGPATSAELHFPNGLATDTHGNLYVADWSNNRVREITKVDPNTQGVNEINGSTSINVYPNPANNLLNIDFSASSGSVVINLYSILGQEVYSHTFSNTAKLAIPVSNLQAGTYLLSIKTFDGRISTKKVEIAR